MHSLSEQEIAQMIARMIGSGVIVTGFHQQGGSLETLFMQLTGGESGDET